MDAAGGEGPTEEKAGGAGKKSADVAEGVEEGVPIAYAAKKEERDGPEEEDERLEAATTEGEAADEVGGATGAAGEK